MVDTSRPVDRTGNIYCGPLVVAAILGTSTGQVADTIYGMRKARDHAARRMRRVTSKVKGTCYTELRAVLERAGYALHDVDVGARYYAKRRNVLINSTATRWASREPLLSADTWLPCSIVTRRCRALWMALHQFRDAHTYIVNTPGHWAIVSGGKWCETFTRGEWVPLSMVPKTGRRVVNAWRIERRTVRTPGQEISNG